MNTEETGTIDIFGIKINKLSESAFLNIISKSIAGKKKITIAYANTNSLNKIYTDEALRNIYKNIDIIHPDGIGVFLASKILKSKNGLKSRLTGSDFYKKLIEESIKQNWSYFFFGHNEEILEEIKKAFPLLKISGIQEGYNFEDKEVIEKINKVNPDIIIIGLSCPKQEKWMNDNKNRINFRVMIAVGDGIKVFADKKIRGPEFMRRLGLEWLVRFMTNPLKNFQKYIIGNPIFILRVLKEKFNSG